MFGEAHIYSVVVDGGAIWRVGTPIIARAQQHLSLTANISSEAPIRRQRNAD